MHIFIDESGTFMRSPRVSSISAVGALMIPDERLSFIEGKYSKIRSSLPKEKGEVKGRNLSEKDIDRVVSLLAKNETLYHVAIVDLSLGTDAEVEAHQRQQAEKITANITPEHYPEVREAVQDMRTRLEATPQQLYVQSIVTFALIAKVIDISTMYFCQRRPEELGVFHWVVDSKNRSKVIDWEDWWSNFVSPWLQTKSLREPMGMFPGGDYSHFKRSFDTEMTPFFRSLVPDPGDGRATNIGKVMTTNFRFSPRPEPGLEMVDILTNATRRALEGNLQIEGWGRIPQLMVHENQHYIQLVSPGDRTEARGLPYTKVLRHFRHFGRDLIAPRFRHYLNQIE